MVVPVPVHPHDDPALMNASETFWATRAMSNAFESWTTKKEEPPACMEHKGPLESEAMKRLVRLPWLILSEVVSDSQNALVNEGVISDRLVD